MIVPFEGALPQIHPRARVAENATLVGTVRLEQDVSIWYGAVLRGDYAPISVGRASNIQDLAVIHTDADLPVTVGQAVTVGHSAILHSCTVEDGCLIGMGAILLNGAVIGEGSLVAAGALVTQNKVFPPHSLIMGSPARAVRTLTPEEEQQLRESPAHYLRLACQLPAWDPTAQA